MAAERSAIPRERGLSSSAPTPRLRMTMVAASRWCCDTVRCDPPACASVLRRERSQAETADARRGRPRLLISRCAPPSCSPPPLCALCSSRLDRWSVTLCADRTRSLQAASTPQQRAERTAPTPSATQRSNPTRADESTLSRSSHSPPRAPHPAVAARNSALIQTRLVDSHSALRLSSRP